MDPLALAQMATSSFGNIFSGIMSFGADKAKQAAYSQAGTQALNESGVAASEKLAQGDQVAAQAATRAAANGGGLGGSAAGVIQNISDNAMFNARAAVYGGVTNANADFYNADVARANAGNALIGAATSTTSTLLSDTMRQQAQRQYMQSFNRLKGLDPAQAAYTQQTMY